MRAQYVAAFGVILMTAACGLPKHRTQINHPLTSGHVDDNRVPIPTAGAYAERAAYLDKGTLASEATLLELDRERACFEVTLRALAGADLSGAPVEADLSTWKPKLYVGTGTDREKVKSFSAGEAMTDARGVVGKQSVRGRQIGTETTCVRHHHETKACEQWSENPVYEYNLVDKDYNVWTSVTAVCFDHGGLVTAEVDAIALRLSRGMGANLGFGWELLGAVKKGTGESRAKARKRKRPAPQYDDPESEPVAEEASYQEEPPKKRSKRKKKSKKHRRKVVEEDEQIFDI